MTQEHARLSLDAIVYCVVCFPKSLVVLRVQCARSRFVACSQVGSDPVNDWRGGQSDHKSRTETTLVTPTEALPDTCITIHNIRTTRHLPPRIVF